MLRFLRKMKFGCTGFTLPELLVACAVLSVMGLMLVQIFSVSKTAFNFGSAKVSTHTFATTIMDDISPKIACANPDTASGIDEAVINPPGGYPADEARFMSSIDYFGATTVSDADGDGDIEDDLTYWRYRIALVGGNIVLERYDPASGADPYVDDPNPVSTTLAASTDEAQVDALRFGVYGDEVRVHLEVTADIRGAGGIHRTDTYELENVTPIHFYNTET